uniref:Putative homing endonuclease n=1 Tax=viral metagenome TaxID=1070528 RepID=A0A6H1ZKV7_9ZZZZ
MLGGPQCLSPDEYIYTPDGVKLVGGVEDGDRILGGVVSGREEYLGQTYEIVFSNGIKLKVSGEHPFWYKKTLRCPARWATCHDLRGRIGRNPKVASGYVQFKKAGEGGSRIEFARLLGYMTSDGCFATGQGVKFTNTNMSFIHEVAELAADFGMKTGLREKGNGYDLHLTYSQGKDNPLRCYIKSLGITQDSFGSITNGDRESLVEFLKGYFNGDGYLQVRKRAKGDSRLVNVQIGFCTATRQKSVEMQYILWRLGILSSIRNELMAKSTRPFYRVIVSGQFYKKLLPLLEAVKYPEKFKEALAAVISQDKRYKEDDEGYWLSVRYVNKLEVSTVVGWQTEGNNEIISYCGMRTHNSGKTCLGPRWLERAIRATAKSGEENDYLAVTSTYDLFKLKMLPELLKNFSGGQAPNEKGDLVNYTIGVGKYWAGIRVIELAEDLVPGAFLAKKESDRMWGRIILRSADARVGLVSATAKAAWLDEPGTQEFGREAWENVRDRVTLARGRILGTATIYCINWVKTDIFDQWKAGNPDMDIIQVDAIENPMFDREEYEYARSTLPTWKFNMKYRGIYEKPAGLIYDSFDTDTCLIPRFPLPATWPRFVGHDFGGANPAAMFYAQDPGTGYFYAYHEYLPGSGKSMSDHVEEFKKITEGQIVIKRAGGSHQEDEIRQGYTAHGWRIQAPKIKNVEAGIERVYALHRLNKVFVFSDLHEYLDEKLNYSRKLDDRHQPTDEIADKSRFHLMDAERYILSDFTPETVTSNRMKITHRS